MTIAPHSSRESRHGGRWSAPCLVQDLLRLAAIERAVAHLVAGWVSKIPDLDDKLEVAPIFEDAMLRATSFRRHALVLLERSESAITADPAWIAPLQTLDGTRNTADVVYGLVNDIRWFLLERYETLEAQLDPLFDARLMVTVRNARDSLSSDRSSIGTPIRAMNGPTELYRSLSTAWIADSGLRLPLDAILWPPADRVPVPARPSGRARPSAGARAHFRKGSRLTIEDLGGELNDNVMAELCALELLCRSSYEHPELPWSSHLAIARHATDEARHAAIFRRLLRAHGVDEINLPQHGANYEHGYSFPECAPGSQRELVWRLLILCTVLEGLAIDKLPVEIGGRDLVGQTDFARALDYIAVDELFHAENGLNLTRRLCAELNLDPILERERVHGRFFGSQRDARMEYLEADPVRAAAEIAILEAPDPDGVPYQSRTEVELRLRASFTLDECQQVERWCYNPIRNEVFDARVVP